MKLVFEFTKSGSMVYISHLDLMRLFLRVLRMTDLKPSYSHGFNPHPKMSMALPLSLGLHSICELLEFESEKTYTETEIAEAIERINERMPEGVRVNSWWVKPETIAKSFASYASASTYEFMCEGISDTPALLEKFFAQDSVKVRKLDKKTGAEVDKEIRPDMLGYRIVKNMRGRMLAEATLSAMPERTLNPVIFFSAFCASSGLEEKTLAPVITRTAILGANNKSLIAILKDEVF